MSAPASLACVSAALLTLAMVPGPAAAEGARMALACDLATACAEDGACGEGEGPVAFTLSPDETDVSGAGSYTVAVDGGEPAGAQGLSRSGPFFWAPSEGTRMTLTLTSGATALWVRQTIDSGTDAPPSAEIDFLTCEIEF